MCRVLGVSASGDYAWRSQGCSRRARDNDRLRGEVRGGHECSRGACARLGFIPTWAGFVVLAVVSQRVVGWAMAAHLRTDRTLDTLNMAAIQRRPEAVIRHSDQGSQYTSGAFGKRCRGWGNVPRPARSATTPTTPWWPRASSPPSNANPSHGGRFASEPKRKGHCSPSLKASPPSPRQHSAPDYLSPNDFARHTLPHRTRRARTEPNPEPLSGKTLYPRNQAESALTGGSPNPTPAKACNCLRQDRV